MRHCTKGTTYTMVRSAKILKPESPSGRKRREAPFPYKSVFSAPEKVECPSPDTLIKKLQKCSRGFVDSGQLE